MSKNRRKWIVKSVLLATLLAVLFAPLVPTTFFLKFGSVDFDVERFPNGVPELDQVAINQLVREKGHYGHDDFPKFVSSWTYLNHNGFGILYASPIENQSCAKDEYCVIEVVTGLSCGGLCGGGAMFHLAKKGDQWAIVHESTWVS